jgi:hypothetical protein
MTKLYILKILEIFLILKIHKQTSKELKIIHNLVMYTKNFRKYFPFHSIIDS